MITILLHIQQTQKCSHLVERLATRLNHIVDHANKGSVRLFHTVL